MATGEIYVLIGSIGLVSGLAGSVGGIAIGFYKAKASFAEQYLTKEDCLNCSSKTSIKAMQKDMNDGKKIFMGLKIDMALVKEKLNIKNEIEELKAMIRAYENGEV